MRCRWRKNFWRKTIPIEVLAVMIVKSGIRNFKADWGIVIGKDYLPNVSVSRRREVLKAIRYSYAVCLASWPGASKEWN